MLCTNSLNWLMSLISSELMPGIELPVGQFSVEPGPRFASADNIYLTIRGRSAHGAQPQDSVDAIVAASGVIQAIQTVVSRNNHPLQPFVVTIGTINGGTSSNIIANEVKLSGTVRSFSPAVRDKMANRLEEVSKAAAAVYGAECEFEYRLLHTRCHQLPRRNGYAAAGCIPDLRSGGAPWIGKDHRRRRFRLVFGADPRQLCPHWRQRRSRREKLAAPPRTIRCR